MGVLSDSESWPLAEPGIHDLQVGTERWLNGVKSVAEQLALQVTR
jgi:hypothetical protein